MATKSTVVVSGEYATVTSGTTSKKYYIPELVALILGPTSFSATVGMCMALAAYIQDQKQKATPAPTPAPTQAPTPAPTEAPTPAPTEAPTQAPTQAPTTPPITLGASLIIVGNPDVIPETENFDLLMKRYGLTSIVRLDGLNETPTFVEQGVLYLTNDISYLVTPPAISLITYGLVVDWGLNKEYA